MLTAFNWKNYKNSPEAIQFKKKAKVDPSNFMLTEFEINKEQVKNLKKRRITVYGFVWTTKNDL